MIVYKVVDLFGLRRRQIKTRSISANTRRHNNIKRYRRLWWWHEERWNQRHDIKSEQWQEWEI